MSNATKICFETNNVGYWLKFELIILLNDIKRRDVASKNMVNNEQKYTLSWYPNGGSIEKISTLIEEKNELSQTISNVRMRYNCYFLQNKCYNSLMQLL